MGSAALPWVVLLWLAELDASGLPGSAALEGDGVV
jgi:hypothetical protein